MKVEQYFVVDSPIEEVWRFFENEGERMGMCIAGAQEIVLTEQDKYRVLITQKVGTMSATFDLKAHIYHKDPVSAMAVNVTGRSVKGARGDLRATADIELEPNGGSTTVNIVANVALGGMLGSLGHKVIAKRTAEITDEFARLLPLEMMNGSVT